MFCSAIAPLSSVLGLTLYKDSDNGEPPYTDSIDVWFGAYALLTYTTNKHTNTLLSFPELLRLSPYRPLYRSGMYVYNGIFLLLISILNYIFVNLSTFEIV